MNEKPYFIFKKIIFFIFQVLIYYKYDKFSSVYNKRVYNPCTTSTVKKKKN